MWWWHLNYTIHACSNISTVNTHYSYHWVSYQYLSEHSRSHRPASGYLIGNKSKISCSDISPMFSNFLKFRKYSKQVNTVMFWSFNNQTEFHLTICRSKNKCTWFQTLSVTQKYSLDILPHFTKNFCITYSTLNWTTLLIL